MEVSVMTDEQIRKACEEMEFNRAKANQIKRGIPATVPVLCIDYQGLKVTDEDRAIAQAQDKISFKAGIREVGKWLEQRRNYEALLGRYVWIYEREFEAFLRGEMPEQELTQIAPERVIIRDIIRRSRR